ncbi:ATP-binding protein [Deinococcus yavapaiensis]|uniref:histidine kinase n=1 Tax=Deinococcus yavapaiensis KR-236 TaxID=694435 RepID=A0A318S538_9DEIO|nr:ATP-binding protein [Deinococcus yavapaiensis]PYE52715.1 PAS domain-containing protein [Deinococcus yavapaiensis KR-236]
MNVGARTSDVDLDVLDALSEAVVWHEDGRVTKLNRAAQDILGVASAQAAGRLLLEVVRDHRLERAALQRDEADVELGERHLLARGVKGALILSDVTRERQRERELREVAMVLSHEFRTPVAAIKGLLEALAVAEDEETRARFVDLGLLETERLVRLVEDLAVEFRPLAERTFAVGEAVERVVRLTHDEFTRRGVTIRTSGLRLLVRCDPDKLVQVLINLLENAARHGTSPGVVTLAARRDANLGVVRVTVTNEGEALSDYETVFEARRRGATSRGSGMGLYIVRRLVEAWRGEVWGRRAERCNEFGFTIPAPAKGGGR